MFGGLLLSSFQATLESKETSFAVLEIRLHASYAFRPQFAACHEESEEHTFGDI